MEVGEYGSYPAVVVLGGKEVEFGEQTSDVGFDGAAGEVKFGGDGTVG